MKWHKFLNHKEAVCEHEYSFMDRDEERCTSDNSKVTCETCRKILRLPLKRKRLKNKAISQLPESEGLGAWMPPLPVEKFDGYAGPDKLIRCTLPVPCGHCWYCKQHEVTS